MSNRAAAPAARAHRVWAPRPVSVAIEIDGRRHPMRRFPDGWWTADVERTQGARYGFILTDAAGKERGPLPDPRSPRQPDGVHSLSQVHEVDPEVWTDGAWTGRQLAGSVLYELHVGTFSPEGTFDGTIARLDHLVDLGVDMVEIMPVNAFAGRHGWGYDGVGWFAVHEPYGGPDGLQRLVDACHARGLAVCLDVVFNHLGPSGNYLPDFGPYLTAADGPWGAGVNVADADSDEVREFILDCALRWFAEFHVDALRLDAVHALHDHGAAHILAELAHRTAALSAHVGRPLSLIAESDQNDPRLVSPAAAGGYGLTAQWDDDIHHAIHAAVSGERQGYYCDFGAIATLADALDNVFVHRGGHSTYRGRRHGRPVRTDITPASAFVTYTTTHDQVGNRAAGDRPSMNLSPGLLVVKAALVLCSAYTPMLFMGEEWGASSPFVFFTAHEEEELAEATRTGRRREFAALGWDPAAIADPQAASSFADSTLRWDERTEGEHERILACYRGLIALRRARPELTDPWLDRQSVAHGDESAASARWLRLERRGATGAVTLVANLGTEPAAVPVPAGGDVLLAWEEPHHDAAAGTVTVPGESFVVLG